MSRNPYLAASRPTSSFTRSSRTSKRNDLTSSKSALLGRSRSSTSVAASLNQFASSSPYGAAAGVGSSRYLTSPASSWQRSSSSSRLTRVGGNSLQDQSSTDYNSTTGSNLSRQSSNETSDSVEQAKLRRSDEESCDNFGIPNDENRNHLKNYQQSKLQQPPQSRVSRSSLCSQDDGGSSATNRSRLGGLTTSSASDLSSPPTTGAPAGSTTSTKRDESLSIASGSVPKHLRHGHHLLKSQSLDISQIPVEKSANSLVGSMSVDRLLSRSESMSESDLRKFFKELAVENEQLRLEIESFDEKEKQKQQEWIRKERQMQRKISELEEENRQIEQWKEEIQKLKDENRSLIRVVTKLSKKS